MKKTLEIIDELKPSKVSYFNIDLYKEFEGMLVRDVNRQTAYIDNPYIDKILEYSKSAQERSKLKFPRKKHPKLMPSHLRSKSSPLVDELNNSYLYYDLDRILKKR